MFEFISPSESQDSVPTEPIPTVAGADHHVCEAGKGQTSEQAKRNTHKRMIALGITSILTCAATFACNPELREDVLLAAHAVDINGDETDRAIEDVIFKVSGVEATVRCDDARIDQLKPAVDIGEEYKNAGFTYPNWPTLLTPPPILLRESVCDTIIQMQPTIRSFYATTEHPDQYPTGSDKFAAAVTIALHETVHAQGVIDEAAADCYAVQHTEDAFVALGYTRAAAENLAGNNVIDMLSESRPAEYISEECRAGGALDLGISDHYLDPHLLDLFQK